MEIELDDASVEALRRAFLCSDIDGDGLISKTDLKIACGVENDEEIESFFKEIKRNSKEFEDFITYDEFIKGIMDVPFLLAQVSKGIRMSESNTDETQNNKYSEDFVQDFTRENPFSTDLVLRYSADSPDPQFASNLLNLLSGNLRNFVKILNVSIMSDSAPEPRVEYDKIKGAENIEGVLKGIEYVIDIAEEKFKNTENRSDTTIGLKKCFSIFSMAVRQLLGILSEMYRYHEFTYIEIRKKLQDSEVQVEQQTRRINMLENSNFKLMDQLRDLENESQHTERLNENILAEKDELINILNQVKSSEKKAKCEVLDILSSISTKETEIAKLRKEINRLTSLKTIQEMKSTHIIPEAFRKKRIEMMTPRASAPNRFWLNSPIPTSPTSNKLHEDSSAAITQDLLKEKQLYLQKQTSEIRLKQQELNRRELEFKIHHEEQEYKYKEEINILHQECQKLLVLWKEEQCKNRSFKSYTIEHTPRNSNTSGSLFEEFQCIGERTEVSSRCSIDTPRSDYDDRSTQYQSQTKSMPIINQQPPKRRNRCCGFLC